MKIIPRKGKMPPVFWLLMFLVVPFVIAFPLAVYMANRKPKPTPEPEPDHHFI